MPNGIAGITRATNFRVRVLDSGKCSVQKKRNYVKDCEAGTQLGEPALLISYLLNCVNCNRLQCEKCNLRDSHAIHNYSSSSTTLSSCSPASSFANASTLPAAQPCAVACVCIWVAMNSSSSSVLRPPLLRPSRSPEAAKAAGA